MDPVLAKFIADQETMIRADQAFIAAIDNLDSTNQQLASSNSQLATELVAAQKTAADLQSQLDNVKLDDAGAQAKVLLLTQQLAIVSDHVSALQAQVDIFQSVIVFDSLESNTWLLAPGASANSNQTGSLTTATQAPPTISSAWLATAPKGPYADAYFYQQFGPRPALRNFTFELSPMLPTSIDSAAPQAIELDIQQVIGGRVINPGFQWDFVKNSMNVWNRSLATPTATGKGDWVPTGLPCARWPSSVWQKMKFECHRDDVNTVFMDAITWNGVRSVLGKSFTTPLLPKPDMLNCAIQLDGNSQGTPFKLYIDRVRLTASR